MLDGYRNIEIDGIRISQYSGHVIFSFGHVVYSLSLMGIYNMDKGWTQ